MAECPCEIKSRGVLTLPLEGFLQVPNSSLQRGLTQSLFQLTQSQLWRKLTSKQFSESNPLTVLPRYLLLATAALNATGVEHASWHVLRINFCTADQRLAQLAKCPNG